MQTLVIIILVAVLVILTLAKALIIVPQSQTMVIERLGKYCKTLDSGINLILPFIDKPKAVGWNIYLDPKSKHRAWIDLREQIFDYPKQNVITKDNVNIEIDALLYFQITDAMKAVYEVADLPRAIEMLTQTTLRNVLGELELDESLTSRDTINNKLRIILDEATDKWGVKVNRVELKDISPPASIQEEMEKQMKAERERRATILIAEGEKRSRILEAEGYKQAEISKAEGDAQALIEKAKAEAEAIVRVKEAFGKEGDYTKYLVAIKYIDALEKMVSGKDNKVVYMPYEASGVLSSLGGIKELLKE